MITTYDREKITALLKSSGKTGMLHTLESKLTVLSPVESKSAPGDLVTMNSIVVYRDLELDEVHEIRLVYQLSPLFHNQVSVMAPLGTALLGTRKDRVVIYEGRDSQYRKIQVEEIKYQPEASGNME